MAPKRIVILRHGEKPGPPDAPDDPSNPNLSQAGQQRAQMLAVLIPKKFGDPDFLFAAASSPSSQRPVQTLQPLAEKLTSARFIVSYPNSNYGGLAQDLLTQQQYVDKLLVVCWHHGNIPELGLALGLSKNQIVTAPEIEEKHGELKWIATVFDRFWILDFQPAPAVQFHSVAQAEEGSQVGAS